MKKILILFIAVIPFFANAQLSKGAVFLGGSVSVSVQNSDNHYASNNTTSTVTRNNSVTISPSIAFMASEKLAWGASVSYYSSLIIQDIPYSFPGTNYKTEIDGWGIGPFGRYYVTLGNSTYFAAQGSLSFSRGTTKTTITGGTPTSTETPSYNVGLNFRPVFYFFSDTQMGR